MFSIFEDVKIVQGHLRSLIMDITRGKIHFIPNTLAAFLLKYHQDKKYDLVIERYKERYPGLYAEYHDFLIENEFVFDIKEAQLSNFPPIPFNSDNPFLLDCIIIHLSDMNAAGFLQLLQLSPLITKNIVIYCSTNHLSPENIELVIRSLNIDNPRMVNIVAHEQYQVLIDGLLAERKLFIARYTPDIINHTFINQTSHPEKPVLSYNMLLYAEALRFNVYFNKKMFITEKGGIKNSHELPDIFGNVNEIDNRGMLEDIVASPEFGKYWRINKDSILVCNQCELRYICTSSAIPTPVKGRPAYIQTECSYNPFIAKWQDEDGYKSLAASGISTEGGLLHTDEQVLNKAYSEAGL